MEIAARARCPVGFEQHGEGLPFILLHGFPLHRGIWDPIRPALVQVCRLITPDLRGFGESPAGDGGCGMADLAADVLALADSLGVGRFAIGGHSMGGYVALAVAAAAPARIAGVALIASRAGADDDAARERRRAVAAHIATAGSGPFLDEFLPRMFAPATLARAPRLLAEVRAMADCVPIRVLIAAQAGMADRPDHAAVLASLTVPVVVLGGAEDALIPAREIERDGLAAQHGRTVLIASAGHLPMLERPIATADTLAAFVRTIGSGA